MPHLGDELAAALARLRRLHDGVAPRATVPVHGAATVDQWLDDGSTLGLVDFDRFTWGDPFWFQPPWRWDNMMGAGVRAAFVASQHAAAAMVAEGRGLIVHLSHWAAQKRIGNTLYGVAKAASAMVEKIQPRARPEIPRSRRWTVSRGHQAPWTA